MKLNNNYVVGNVISIDGLKVTIIMRNNTNLINYFYDGVTYRGVNIGEYIGIIRGPYKIVGRVEREYLSDKKNNKEDHTYSLDRFERNIEISVVGYFYCEDGIDKFKFGLKYLPMIFNEVVLLTEQEVSSIIIKGTNVTKESECIRIGKSVKEDFNIYVPINGLFNKHIGIFGNTGSGKSNTLTKLFTEVFSKKEYSVFDNSKFVILDFNGEYVGDTVFDFENCKKRIVNLSTNNDSDTNQNKIIISSYNFWNKETLSILFSATEKTQQPFIQKMLDFYINGNPKGLDNKMVNYIKLGFKNVFEGNNNKESLNLLISILSMFFNENDIMGLPLMNFKWHSKSCSYFNASNSSDFVNKYSFEELNEKAEVFNKYINANYLKIEQTSVIDKLVVLINLQLIYGLRYNNVQFEHISPLLNRIQSMKELFNSTILIDDNVSESQLEIISFKDCDYDAKKILPLLISKQLYSNHLKSAKPSNKIEKTCHLIVDEAHNILSEQASREAESFKDYRLDVFEQIVKEGRKFGFYLTIASQRPYDISTTIISQLHNFFIHRLVNEFDLKMLSTTMSTLDVMSKSMISNLTPGQCIITGTLFELPLLIQVDELAKEKSPNSEDADILSLWKNKSDDNKNENDDIG